MAQRPLQLEWMWIAALFAIAGCGGGGSGSMGPNSAPVGGRSDTIIAVGSTPPNNGFGNSSGGQYYFSPAPDTVPAGTQISFQFNDVTHTVTFDGGPVTLMNIPATTNADSVRTFANPGTYTWHCSIHPYMHGTLVAQ